MMWLATYNLYEYFGRWDEGAPMGGASSGVLTALVEAETKSEVFLKLPDVVERKLHEHLMVHSIEPLNYELPENFTPLPFDEVEANV